MSAPRSLFAGRSTLDALYLLDDFPAEDTKVYARDLRLAPGGPALNAALTHAHLGGSSVLISAVGGGLQAGVVRAVLARHPIDLIDLAKDTSYETPLTTVLVNRAGATRTIVNPPLSEAALRRLDQWSPAWGEMPAVALTDGFHLQETLPVLAACGKAGAALCLDGGSWKAGAGRAGSSSQCGHLQRTLQGSGSERRSRPNAGLVGFSRGAVRRDHARGRVHPRLGSGTAVRNSGYSH